MLNSAELTVQRYATMQFIAANPSEITLTSRNEAMVNGTVVSTFGGPRPPQIFRLIWLEEKGVYEKPPSGTRKFDFAIVGEYDAELAIGDFWEVGEQEFIIEAISPFNGWEVKAYGVSNGPKPG